MSVGGKSQTNVKDLKRNKRYRESEHVDHSSWVTQRALNSCHAACERRRALSRGLLLLLPMAHVVPNPHTAHSLAYRTSRHEAHQHVALLRPRWLSFPPTPTTQSPSRSQPDDMARSSTGRACAGFVAPRLRWLRRPPTPTPCSSSRPQSTRVPIGEDGHLPL